MKTTALTRNLNDTVVGLVLLSIGLLVACGVAQAGSGDSPFPRPPEIKKAVDFWTRVYTEVDSNSGFVHDDRELNVVYEVYPLSSSASPRRQHRSIRNRIRYYEKLLTKIAGMPEADLSPEERRVRRLWGEDVSQSQLRDAAKRVRFQRGQSDRMIKGLKRAATYEKRIREILRHKGVPEQLAALPHVESSYNPGVRSKAGAAGLWQIMPATGRRYLRVNDVLDERLDPYKATTAAAQLLKHNYSVLKSWPLAITAYNHGLSGVRRAVRKTGTTDIDTIVRQYNGRAFKFASRNFYAAFLAAYDVSASRRAEFKQNSASSTPVVALNAYMPAAAITEGFGIDERLLKEHNPDLGAAVWSGEKYIPKSYQLRIPVKQDAAVLQARVALLEQQSGQAKQVPDLFYRVKSGDNLDGIARRYDTSIDTLMAMNSLRSRHRINAGQVLRIPKKDEVPAATPLITASPAKKTIEPARQAAAIASGARIGPGAVVAHMPESASLSSKSNQQVDVATDGAMDGPPETEEPASEENETVAIAQSDLAADPADYEVAEDDTIEVQVGETLGHYAHWLNLPTQQLRDLNGLSYGQQVIVGRRIRLGYSKVQAAAFEQKRRDFHTGIQNRFFEKHRIVDVKDHVLKEGDSLWELSTQTYQVPFWLLRQYNPDLTSDTVLALSGSLRVPVVRLNDDNTTSRSDPISTTSQQLAGLD
jgi:membrane-bound lytic murein transglycosylase D